LQELFPRKFKAAVFGKEVQSIYKEMLGYLQEETDDEFVAPSACLQAALSLMHLLAWFTHAH